MHSHRVLWILVLISSHFAGYAQSWVELYSSAEQAYQNGEYDSALNRLNRSRSLFLREVDQKTDHHAAILRLMQIVCYETGDYRNGLDLAKKEVTLRQSEMNVPYAEALVQVGSFQQALEDFAGAEATFRQSLAVFSQFYLPDDLSVVDVSLNIGISLFHQNKEDDAYIIFKNVLEKDLQELTAVIIQSSYYYGQLALERGEYDRAERSFGIVRSFYEGQGLTESPDYAALLTSLARIADQKEDWDQAEALYAAAQSVYESINQIDLTYYRVLNARAINFQKMHAPDKAEALLSKIPPEALTGELAAIVLSNKAMSSKVNNDLASAERYYREALSNLNATNPSDAILYSETLQNLAVILSEREQVQEALQLLEEAGGLLKGDSGRMASHLIKKGIVLLKTGNKTTSLNAFSRALELIEAGRRGYTPEWVMAMNGIGSVHTTTGDVDSADSAFSLVLSAYQKNLIPQDDNYPVVLNNYASVQQMKGQFLTAYDLFYKAAQHLKTAAGENSLVYATTLENLAQVNINRGLLTAARGQIDSAVTIIGNILGQNSIQYASAQITLGRYHQNAGDYPAAEPCFKTAYALLREAKDTPLPDVVRSTNALALFYQTMGNYEEAGPLFKESLSAIENAGNTTTADYSTTLQNLATLYQVQGKLELAGPLLEKALGIDEVVFGSSHPQYIIALKNLGVLYQKQQRLDEAQSLLERALGVTKDVLGEDHPSYAVTVSNLAALYQDQEKYDDAEKAWQQSVALRKRILGEEHPDYARSLYGLASVHFARGNLDDAREYFEAVIDQYLRQIKENFPFMSEKEKGAFYLKIQPVFETYQDFCVQYIMEDTDSAAATLFRLYDIQLSTKAILLNSTAKVRQQILATNNGDMIAAYHEWLSLKEAIGKYYSLTEEERVGHRDIGVMQNEANALEKELSVASEIFRSQFGQKDFTARDVQASLSEGEAALEIMRVRKKFHADSIYYVGLLLRKDRAAPEMIIWHDGATLENRVYKYYRNAVRFMIRDSVSYQRFWKPLTADLKGINHIYLSSDGIFNKVNLSTLQNPGNQRWVLDDFTISLVSNTRDILEREPANQAMTSEVHLYGNIDFNLSMDGNEIAMHRNALGHNLGFDGNIPLLPGTEAEIAQINELMKASSPLNVSVHMRRDADEESVKRIVNPKILHIATHGFFLNDIDISDVQEDDAGKFLENPLLRSGLLLAGAGVREDDSGATRVEDGVLTAYEAMNLTLDQTELVVMSACDTGLGEIRNGEGVYGLQRSFLVAGASAVLMSLWQVDDIATQELMVQFYRNWLEGGTKLDAFRKAQLSLKEKYPSPHYWGAFIMVGY